MHLNLMLLSAVVLFEGRRARPSSFDMIVALDPKVDERVAKLSRDIWRFRLSKGVEFESNGCRRRCLGVVSLAVDWKSSEKSTTPIDIEREVGEC